MAKQNKMIYENTNRKKTIKGIIKFLKKLDKKQSVEVEIQFGVRDTTPLDEDYTRWACTQTHDGSFVLTIRGENYK